MTKKALFVFGTRPEAIKMAPVIEAARNLKGKLDAIVCVTGQHRYLLDQALAEFGIKPDIDLNLMKPDQTLCDITSVVMRGVRDIYLKVRPDIVLVQGDTSTVFSASLAAYYENIRIGHIEAGLRSGDNKNPFPEEVNRRFVSLVAEYNFCPTADAGENLLKEGISQKKIFVTGNTIIDSLRKTLEIVRKKEPVIKGIDREFCKTPYVFITGHRRESFGGGMKDICLAVKTLAARHPDVNWLWTVHLNPNVRKVVFNVLSGLRNVRLIEPLPYRESVYLMDNCEFIISDSGGIQEEAPYLNKRVLVTRICTERPEAVRAGTSILVGTDLKKIIAHADKLLKSGTRAVDKKNTRLFGDGRAAGRIIDVIIKGSCREFKNEK